LSKNLWADGRMIAGSSATSFPCPSLANYEWSIHST
jgi:hypothetical protein